MTNMYVWNIPWYGRTAKLVVLAEGLTKAKSMAKKIMLNSKFVDDVSELMKVVETEAPNIHRDGYVGVW